MTENTAEESIEVGYAPAAIVGRAGIYHKYILYTNKDGDQLIARGGPLNFVPGSTGTDIPTLPFGNIKAESGVYDEESPDWDPARDSENPDPNATPHPRETIAEGSNLSQQWGKIEETMQRIGNSSIPYDPRSSNSNASVDEALREAGLQLPKMDGPGENWSPGSDFDLPGGDVPSAVTGV